MKGSFKYNILLISLVIMFGVAITACGESDDSANSEFSTGTEGGVILNMDYPEQPERMVMSNSEMTIVVDDVTLMVNKIISRTKVQGGYVVSSNVSQEANLLGKVNPTATITIRVPEVYLAQTIIEIELASLEVSEKVTRGEDITKEYTDLQSRLRNLEDASEQLGKIMDEAKRTEDVLEVFNELQKVNAEAEVIRGQIKYYEEVVAMASLTVTISQVDDGSFEPGEVESLQPIVVMKNAYQALLFGLKAILNILIWLVIVLLPIAIIVWVVYSAWKKLWGGIKKITDKLLNPGSKQE